MIMDAATTSALEKNKGLDLEKELTCSVCPLLGAFRPKSDHNQGFALTHSTDNDVDL